MRRLNIAVLLLLGVAACRSPLKHPSPIVPPALRSHPEADPNKTWRYDEDSSAYVHRLSGFAFPDVLGPFPRHWLTIYDPDGRNVSAAYDIIGNISVTIYVYPIPGQPADSASSSKDVVLEAHYRACMHEITTRYKANCVSEGPFALEHGTARLVGKQAKFQYSRYGISVGSILYLFHHGDNFLKLRATYRTQEEEYALAKISELLEAFKWPEKPK
jgi:hypothetical protein